MLASKWTGNDNKTKVTLVIKKSWLKECKNNEYVKLTLNLDTIVGLDEKNQCTVADIINVNKLLDNTKH